MRQPYRFAVALACFSLLSLMWPYDALRSEDSRGVVYQGSPWTTREVPVSNMDIIEFPDLWEGTLDQVLFEAQFNLGPALGLYPQDGRIRTPPGHRVLPGTGWLNFTFTAQGGDGTHSAFVLTARAPNGFARTFTVAAGSTSQLFIDHNANDWAPDENTRWTFDVRAPDGMPARGTLRVTIGRTADPLPAYMALPDGWRGAESVLVFRENRALQDASITPMQSAPSIGISPPPASLRIKPTPGREMDAIRIIMVYNSTTPPDQHYRPLLSWHGANRATGMWEETSVKPTEQRTAQANGLYRWDIPVMPHMWDSPFAKATGWGFYINWYGPAGPHATRMDGNYQLTVEALRVPG